ncbi:MAG: hypothetical protein ACTH0V_00320 [Microbacteriaceae bacterium]
MNRIYVLRRRHVLLWTLVALSIVVMLVLAFGPTPVGAFAARGEDVPFDATFWAVTAGIIASGAASTAFARLAEATRVELAEAGRCLD